METPKTVMISGDVRVKGDWVTCSDLILAGLLIGLIFAPRADPGCDCAGAKHRARNQACLAACRKVGAVAGQVMPAEELVVCKCWRDSGAAPFEMVIGNK